MNSHLEIEVPGVFGSRGLGVPLKGSIRVLKGFIGVPLKGSIRALIRDL